MITVVLICVNRLILPIKRKDSLVGSQIKFNYIYIQKYIKKQTEKFKVKKKQKYIKNTQRKT